MVSGHWEEKQNNTLNENNTIHTLVSVLCPQPLWASVLTVTSGHIPRVGRAHGHLEHRSQPLPFHTELRMLELFGLACWGLPVLEATAIPSWL